MRVPIVPPIFALLKDGLLIYLCVFLTGSLTTDTRLAISIFAIIGHDTYPLFGLMMQREELVKLS